MIMLASELEADSSFTCLIETFASNVLVSENADDWLRYLASFSRGSSATVPFRVQHQPLFSHIVSSPQRTTLPDESVVCGPLALSANSFEVVARAALEPKANHIVSKPIRANDFGQKPFRLPNTAPVVTAVPAPTAVEVYKPKHVAELLDFDAEEPDTKKGPQKKRRCR